MTEADKKEIERVAKAILDSPIEEVIECWNQFSLRPNNPSITNELRFAVHAYPGVHTRLGEAINLEKYLETGEFPGHQVELIKHIFSKRPHLYHLGQMDIPEMRKDLSNLSNVRWLVRNLRVRNGKKPMIKEVIKELNLMVRKGN